MCCFNYILRDPAVKIFCWAGRPTRGIPCRKALLSSDNGQSEFGGRNPVLTAARRSFLRNGSDGADHGFGTLWGLLSDGTDCRCGRRLWCFPACGACGWPKVETSV